MEKVEVAIRDMGRTIKCPQVWKPSLYMYLSLALSISTHEGQFYWYTDPNAGPAFSQVFLSLSPFLPPSMYKQAFPYLECPCKSMCSLLFIYFLLGVVICVNGSCLCRVNVWIVSTFANPNLTRIINMSTFANPNSTYLLFMLGGSTRI